MKRHIAIGVIVAALGVLPVASARAATNPSGTGQPSQSCGSASALTRPGNASSAPGSAFNPNGTAGAVYANPGSQGGLSSGNTHVVSQYDVACFQVSQSH